MNVKDKAKIIFKNHGYAEQLEKLEEEVDEFIEAVKDYETGKGGLDHVVEEFGDMYFLMTQFQLAYHIDNENILHVMQYKSDRQMLRDKE